MYSGDIGVSGQVRIVCRVTLLVLAPGDSISVTEPLTGEDPDSARSRAPQDRLIWWTESHERSTERMCAQSIAASLGWVAFRGHIPMHQDTSPLAPTAALKDNYRGQNDVREVGGPEGRLPWMLI